MANKAYTSIIDAMLDEREPDWKDLDLADAKKSGEGIIDRTHDLIDKDFMDEIAESASRHTPITGPKSGALSARMHDKENATPQVAAVKADWRKDAHRYMDDYKDEHGSNSLLDEVTMSLESAGSEGKVEKKEWSDAQVQSYVKGLLNQGETPSKVAAQLEKIAELELFNRQSATDYLQRNAGMLGLAYLEPNTYMDKASPTYRHDSAKLAYGGDDYGKMCPACSKAIMTPSYTCPQCGHKEAGAGDTHTGKQGSNDCVRQHNAWKHAGITPRARSVKQITACQDCQFFKKDASGKRCNLYHLPVIANPDELSQLVNHLTPGVPNKRKRAALVQIANRDGERSQAFDAGKTAQTNIFKTADAHVENQAQRKRPVAQKFYASHIAKLHAKGVALSAIYKWADSKFGSMDTSVALRGFVQSLRKDGKGKVVVATGDLKFLNSIGIRSEALQGGAKCASCPAHFYATDKDQGDKGASLRVDGKFAQRTLDVVRGEQKEVKPVTLTADKIRMLHQAGHSLEKIYTAGAKKIGTVEAKKAVARFVADLKKVASRKSISEQDHAFLVGKLGFKPEALRTLDSLRQTDRVVAKVNGMLSYPGMGKQAADKVAVDGHSILKEYDLASQYDQEIDIREPERLAVEGRGTFGLDTE